MPTPWPVAIYLDTNILLSLPIERANADFEQLKQLCVDLNIPIFTPNICLDELLHKRRSHIRQAIARTEGTVASVAEYVAIQPTLSWGKSADEILVEAEATVQRRLAEEGIKVIPNADVPPQDLVRMSIQKTKPFEEKGEKGFRDTIILFSIVLNAKTLPSGYQLLVTGDRIFADSDVISLASEHGVDLRVVDSVQIAVEHLEQFLSAAMREVRAAQSAALQVFLEPHFREIEAYVRGNGQFSSGFLLESPLLGWSLQEIEDAALIGIENAQRGPLTKGQSEGPVPISFTAKMKFTLILKRWAAPEQPMYRIGLAPTPSVRTLFSPGPQEQVITHEVEKGVRVEGSVHFRRPSEYSDLQLKEVTAGITLIESLFRAT